MPHFQNFQLMSQWIVDKGEIDFWKDNWLGVVLDPNYPTPMSVVEGLQRLEESRHQFTANQLAFAQKIILQADTLDVLVFTPSPSVKFSICTYMEMTLHSHVIFNGRI